MTDTPWLIGDTDIGGVELDKILYLVAIDKAYICFDTDGLGPENTVECLYKTFGPQKPFFFTVKNKEDLKGNIFDTLVHMVAMYGSPKFGYFNVDSQSGRYFLDLYRKIGEDIFIYSDTYREYKIAINLGSIYGPGSADAEDLPYDKLSVLEYLADTYGYLGLYAWVAKKRGVLPQKLTDWETFNKAYETVTELANGATLIRDIRERRYDVSISDPIHQAILAKEDQRGLEDFEKAAREAGGNV